jgi:transcriptional regulator with XRE-family HTH domain
MTPSDVVAARVKDLRISKGLTVQQLADRCRDIGAPTLTASAITNIESGRRKDGRRTRILTIDELLPLALALDVPPIALLIPGVGEQMDVTPEFTPDALRLVTWINGITPQAGLPSVFFSRHAGEVRGYRSLHEEIEAVSRSTTEQRGKHLERLALLLGPLLPGFVPTSVPAEWLDEMVLHGWLEAGLLPGKNEEEKGSDG